MPNSTPLLHTRNLRLGGISMEKFRFIRIKRRKKNIIKYSSFDVDEKIKDIYIKEKIIFMITTSIFFSFLILLLMYIVFAKIAIDINLISSIIIIIFTGLYCIRLNRIQRMIKRMRSKD